MHDHLLGENTQKEFSENYKQRIKHKQRIAERGNLFDTFVSFCLLIPSKSPVVIKTPKPPTKKYLKELYDEYVKRIGTKNQSWNTPEGRKKSVIIQRSSKPRPIEYRGPK